MSVATSPLTIDFETLLAPIEPGAPAGRNLRYEGTYDRIREIAREEGDLPQGIWQTETKRADWVKVSEICVDVIAHRSKDLQVAAWLLEAWLNLYGFAGVAAGFQLLADLLDRFWADVYPQAEDGDLEYRASPFTWINEKLEAELKLIPFVYPQEPDAVPLSWADWEMACLEAGAMRSTRAKKALSQDDFQRALHLTPFNVIEDQFSAVSTALFKCSRVRELLERRFAGEAPSLQNIHAALERVHTFLGTFTHQISGSTLLAMADAVAIDEQAQAPLQTATPPVLPHPEVGPISSRAEAYHWLAAAAEFLSRTEPHSPTPYLIRRAIRWGNLNLEQLLPELVRNQAEITEIARLLQLEIQANPGD